MDPRVAEVIDKLPEHQKDNLYQAFVYGCSHDLGRDANKLSRVIFINYKRKGWDKSERNLSITKIRYLQNEKN